jgi:hypothetical protein
VENVFYDDDDDDFFFEKTKNTGGDSGESSAQHTKALSTKKRAFLSISISISSFFIAKEDKRYAFQNSAARTNTQTHVALQTYYTHIILAIHKRLWRLFV